jgi:hydroxyacylglutathione hydrolase
VHADHVSGDQELKAATGANIYIHESAPVEYRHQDLKEGDVFEIGAAKIEILHTPGHTPNAISLLVTDTVRSEEPQMLLTGDLLFVGDIGRPDLPGEEILDEQVKICITACMSSLPITRITWKSFRLMVRVLFAAAA